MMASKPHHHRLLLILRGRGKRALAVTRATGVQVHKPPDLSQPRSQAGLTDLHSSSLGTFAHHQDVRWFL